MPANENVCIGPLNGPWVSHCLSLAESNPAAFRHWMLSVYFSGSASVDLGSHLMVYTPHSSGGSNQPLKYPSSASAATFGYPGSPLTSLPLSLSIRLCWSWFCCLSEVIRPLSCYCSVVCSGWFLHNLVVIPDWSWEEVSVKSIHSSAILDQHSFFFSAV